MTDALTTVRPGRAPRPAQRRAASRNAILAVVLTGQFMALLDASVVNVAAPAIHASLHASGAGLQLVIAGYVITYAVLLVTGARLGDIAGHRTMFLAGVALFTLASLGCGLAGSASVLVTLRFVQGAGAAAMIPQVLSLIQRSFPGPARARPMRLYAAVLAGGAVAGQVIGGLVVSADLWGSSWRPVFLLNVPVGVALLVAGARLLPRGRGEPGRGLDPAGLAILTPSVLALLLPLVLGQSEHWPAWGWVCLAASVAGFAVFAAVERRVAADGSPLIPGRVLRLPGVAMGIAAMFAVLAVFGGFFFILALHLQGGLGESALRAGLTFAPAGIAFALVSLNWQRIGAAGQPALIIGGFAASAAGLLALAFLLRDGRDGGGWLYLSTALTGAGMAASFSPLMTAVLLRVPVADAADATGVIVTVNQLALVTGVATFGTLYLNLAGRLPLHPAAGDFRQLSAHAATVTLVTLAAGAVAGGVLASAREVRARASGRPGLTPGPAARSA
jgi:MFS family permease